MSIEPSKRLHDNHDYTWFNVVTVSNDNGSVELEICDFCGYIARTTCDHIKNSWNEEGTRLTCDLCGADGT